MNYFLKKLMQLGQVLAQKQSLTLIRNYKIDNYDLKFF